MIITTIYTVDINYCDDYDVSFSNTDNNGRMITNGRVQNNEYGYQTHYQDGTPIYESYSERPQYTSRYQTNENISPVYQAYNENLQLTSEGYRYEMNGDTTYRYTTLNEENFITDFNGNTVYAKYYGTDVNGNNVYNYSNDGSTMLGLIEPTKSEIIGNGYYVGGPNWKIVDTSPTTFSRRMYNKVKFGIKNHIAKSSDEAQRIHNMKSKEYANYYGRYKSMQRAKDSKRVIEMLKGDVRDIKVRKFD